MRAPHFLRVVQSLSFVSGFGPVAIVAGVALVGAGCFTGPSGTAPAPEGVTPAPSDAAADATDGSFGGGVMIPPDGGADGTILVGGPLLPPELPA